MNDLIYFGFMALVVLLVIVAIVQSAAQYKSYSASTLSDSNPQRETSKPFRSQRAQEIWNRLNPRIYLDDDKTEPFPEKEIREK